MQPHLVNNWEEFITSERKEHPVKPCSPDPDVFEGLTHTKATHEEGRCNATIKEAHGEGDN